MLERLHEHGFTDLDPAHLILLQYPGPQGARPSDLAARLRMSKQSVNYLLGRARAARLPRAEADPDDLRSKRIHLTDRGRALIPVIRGAVAEVEEEWSRLLGRKRFDQLRGLLFDLNQSIEN